MSEEAEKDYRALWQRLGLSIDWSHTYRTIDELSRCTSQVSFLDLYRKGLVYRQQAPAIWCPECRTAIAQADRGDGVVVLADLGSAILTVRSVLEHENGVMARLADAPFVEGAVAAAVIAAAGQPLEEVIRSAEEVRGASKL